MSNINPFAPASLVADQKFFFGVTEKPPVKLLVASQTNFSCGCSVSAAILLVSMTMYLPYHCLVVVVCAVITCGCVPTEAQSQPKTKVAVLGGGIGALASAYFLSKDEGLRQRCVCFVRSSSDGKHEIALGVRRVIKIFGRKRQLITVVVTRFDVTVYQIGWRLGGKASTGRNMEEGFGHRIEEKGIHIVFGSYPAVFDILEDIYNELNMSDNHPFSTLEKALLPHDTLTMAEFIDGQTKLWDVEFPIMGKNPWERTSKDQRTSYTPMQVVEYLLRHLSGTRIPRGGDNGILVVGSLSWLWLWLWL